MENFLNEQQIEHLKDKWNHVTPEGRYVFLYKDEFDRKVWEQVCEIFGINADNNRLCILSFAHHVTC